MPWYCGSYAWLYGLPLALRHKGILTIALAALFLLFNKFKV
jgi:hypothetical protein